MIYGKHIQSLQIHIQLTQQPSHREWVRGQAQDYILTYFTTLSTRRREAHNHHIRALQSHYSHFYTQPHPSEISQSEQMLKRAIDADWAASVQRYPEVLEYFYSLVEIRLPDDGDSRVSDPPLSALSGAAKGRRIPRIMEGRGKDKMIESRERDSERDSERRQRRRPAFAAPPYPSYGV